MSYFTKIQEYFHKSSVLSMLVVICVIFTGFAVQSELEGKRLPKVDICHMDEGSGTFKLINVSQNAMDAHLNHGDSLADDPYNGLDAMCMPSGALVFARAYRDANEDGVYTDDDGSGDILYAQVVDTDGSLELSIGDTVEINVYPTDFSLDPLSVASTTNNQCIITSLGSSNDFELVRVLCGSDATFIFRDLSAFEDFQEIDPSTSSQTIFLRDVLTSPFTFDGITLSTTAWSMPDINANIFLSKPLEADEPWLNVEIDLLGL